MITDDLSFKNQIFTPDISLKKQPYTKKHILLLSHNFSPEPTGIGKYNGEMMEWLTKKGFETTVITTFPYYPYWKVQAPYNNKWYKKEVLHYEESGTGMQIYRCPIYIPDFPTGKKRMMQDLLLWPSTTIAILKQIFKLKKYDLIITVAPPFHLAYLMLWLKKITGGKVLYHIQDLQIDAAQQLGIVNNNRLFKILYKIEKRILDKADYISTISEGMIKKIKSKINKEIILFPNWIDTSVLYPLKNRDDLKPKWGFSPKDFICLYSGSLGEKQGIENILYTAERLKLLPQVKFVIAGSGPYQKKLLKLKAALAVDNVFFFPVQEKENFNAFLNMADLHLIPQKGDAGDLVMPSKLTSILSVGGVSLVTASENTTLGQVIVNNHLGFVCEPDNIEQMADTIKACVTHDITSFRHNARAYALAHLNINNIMNSFLGDVNLNYCPL